MKTLTAIIIVGIVIVLGVVLFGGDKERTVTAGEGSITFSLTDVTADMEAVSEVELGVDSVEVYSDTQGWVAADTRNDSFALLELNESGEWKLLAEADVEADTYTRARLNIDSVTVVGTDGSESEAALPGNTVEIETIIRVTPGTMTSVNMDILASESLHTTSNGSYVFAPVVVLESRSNAEISIESDVVTAQGGVVDSQVTAGVDVDGTTKADFRLSPSAELRVEGGNIMLNLGLGESEDEETPEETDSEAEADVEVETDASVELNY